MINFIKKITRNIKFQQILFLFIIFFILKFNIFYFFFFFNDTATTEIYTLSLHDALPISRPRARSRGSRARARRGAPRARPPPRPGDRKSTRLNSSHANISYAVFCLKKKKNLDTTLSPEKTYKTLIIQ